MSIFILTTVNPVYSGNIRMISRQMLDEQVGPLLPNHRDKPPDERVIVVGFDGFSFRVLDRLLPAGQMPHFQKLMDDGARIALKSTDFPSSAVAWPAIVTGCHSSETGLESFFTLDSDTYEFKLTNATFRNRKAVWEQISEQGKRSIVMNVPMTYPPDDIDGITIAGILSPDKGAFTFPKTLSPVLRQMGYRTGYQSFRKSMRLGETAFNMTGVSFDINDLFDISLNQYQVFSYLKEKVDWDFAMIVFTIPDRLQHNETQLGSPVIEHTYRQMDVLLGGIMAKLPEKTSLIVLSDHGFRAYTRVFNLGTWLIDQGYLILKSDGSPDWTKSQLIPIDRVGSTATLRWNIRDREAMGTVSGTVLTPDSEVFLVLKKKLLTITDNAGEPVVKRVTPLVSKSNGPDILVTAYETFTVKNDIRSGSQIVSKTDAPIYDHEHDGVGFMFKSGTVKPGTRIAGHVRDIVPTILYLMGLPVSESLDGNVLKTGIEPKYLTTHPVRTGQQSLIRIHAAPEALDNSGVMDQLRSLGYLGNSD